MTNRTLSSESKQLIKILILCFASLLLIGAKLFGQTPGAILDPAVPATNPLDPDGDGWISATGAAFVSEDGQGESEIAYIPIPQVDVEPDNDLQTGSACGKTDMVDLPNGKECSYILYDDVDGIQDNGDDRLLMRIRCAKPATSGSFGYSILLDTDEAFGFGASGDPNAVAGNPGFEIEIRVKTGGGPGIYVEDVDGTTSGSAIISYDIDSNYQQSYALVNDSDCSDDPVFHDFFVLTSEIGITSATKLRPLSATSSSGNTVLGGSASDIGGLDGADPNQDSAFIDVIGFLPPTSGDDLGESGTFPIELGEFNGEYADGSTILTWVTVTETNNMRFEVQKSSDNFNYATFTELDGAGTKTTPSNYRAIDPEPYSEVTYYRLKQVDFDGAYTYTHAIMVTTTVTISENELLTVYPNPSTGVINMKIETSIDYPTVIQVFDTRQSLVKEIKYDNSQGMVVEAMDLTQLPKGIYMIRATQQTRRRTRKVLIM